ncbi:hypothetical protein V3C99_007129 [Haemonchus contortus]|uniref:Uncharacterized protein n=1 Tax=Haemonchus contortus TaxID=6289 RepID=A0A7I5EE13_HAECO
MHMLPRSQFYKCRYKGTSLDADITTTTLNEVPNFSAAITVCIHA